jgi:two-component system KDP operon response regulator KdpE
VKLSRKEFDLLAELAINLGRPVPHEDLLRAVWGSPDADIRYLRVYVSQVREKIEGDPQRPTLLMAEPGFGYRLG